MKDGYKKTELGWIPVDWAVKRLEEFSISSSYGPRFSAELYDENGNCRIIRGTDVIDNGKVCYEAIPYASISNEVLEKHRLEENDFVVITTADCGVSFVFDNSGVFMPSAYMVRIRFNDNINPYYVNRFFNNKIIKSQVEKHIRKGTVANLPGSDLLKFKICIPPLKEQEKIADILSTVDSQIDDTDKLIEKTKELKNGLMQRLLTKGIGHTDFKKTEVGEIPVEWQTKRLAEISDIKRGASPRPIKDKKWFSEDKNIGWIRISDVTASSKYLFTTTQYLSDEGVKKSRLVKENDLIMSICATVGKPIILKMCACIHDGFILLDKIDEKKYEKEFLYYVLQKYESQFKSMGQTGTQANLNTSLVGDQIIAVPLLEEQKKIGSILSEVDMQIEEYENKKMKLEELKKGLMQQLLTGKVRVKV
ncbi:restriction endonuclease subunit S [Clostridium sp.]|uniref:restriction endonuclease subunit S n=1 Tax=Clostridium sp. TaxID=1506 RepID=UPI0029027E94|nr:restriction endonuclease subunit S [Clostridium sp.]MDU1968988.1 restriction endonuclease subunit S [Clostridium perfringens]MDU1823974.1 restriction endonuclease subunit S [Clostridium sp.]MDU1841029.1 restriction endonuclease subunit S [Clostridium sp.]MDU2691408.1 restriction endonuclease subunit S [Clostridium sp.]MDU2957267.1 restriction endonuclease subunit S [Clostridium sp.]